MSKGSERRQFPRVVVRVLVDFESTDTYLYDYSMNLSEGGIFIETEKPIPLGEQLTLRFTLPNIDRVFEAKGKVAWHKPAGTPAAEDGMFSTGPGMGVTFDELEEADRDLIREYVTRMEQHA